MGTEGVGDVLALQVPADRGWDQRTDSGRPPPGPNPPLAAGRCVPERPWMMNETWLWSGVGPDVETQTSGPAARAAARAHPAGAVIAGPLPEQPRHPLLGPRDGAAREGAGLAEDGQAREDIPGISITAQSRLDKCLIAKRKLLICCPLCSATGEGFAFLSQDARRSLGMNREALRGRSEGRQPVRPPPMPPAAYRRVVCLFKHEPPPPGMLCPPAPEPQGWLRSTHAHCVLPPLCSPGLQGPR